MRPDGDPNTDGRAARLLPPLALFVLALIPRLSFLPGVFRPDGVLVGGLDPYYHLRRIDLVLTNGPALPSVDRYANFPEGYVADWPPGFDLLMAAGIVLLRPFTDAGPEAIAALLVPLLGALTCLAVYALGAAAYGRRAGFLAGLLLAASTAHIDYTMVGRVDHHAVESLGLAAVLGATGAVMAGPAARGRRLLLVLALVGTPAFWPGAVAFAPPAVLALAHRTWRSGRDLRDAGTLALAALLALALAMTTPWGREGQVVYYALSLFQPLFFGGSALALAALALLAGRRAEGRLPDRSLAFGAAALIVLAVGAALAVPPLRRAVFYVFQFESQISVVSESDSPLSRGLGGLLRAFTPALLLWPLAAFRGLRRALAREDAPGLDLAITAGLFTVGMLGFVQYRFVAFAILPLVLLSGEAIDAAIAAGTRRLTETRLRPVAGAGVVLAAAITLLPGLRPYLAPRDEPLNQLTQSMDALHWLRDVAPPTSHFHDPEEQPEYAVLAGWIFGHWVTWIGRKPNVCNPLGQTDVNLRGLDRAARILFEDDEPEMLRLLAESGVRYLLLTPLLEQDLLSMALRLGKDTSEYSVDASREVAVLTDAHLRTVHSQLFLGDGRGATMPDGEVLPPMERVRLVFESAATMSFNGRPLSYAKVFEVVEGAELTGRCEADAVRVELDLRTTRGRDLRYARTAAVVDGAFSLRVPYPTEPAERTVRATGPYRVSCGEATVEVAVPARAVAEGASVAASP